MNHIPRPGVSVIIPTLDRPLLLRRSIESVLNQDYRPIEIVIIDDTELHTAEILCNNYRLQNHPVTYIPNSRSKGASGARNTGILASKFKLIAFLDDDDYWLENKLSFQINLLKEKEEQDFLISTDFYSINQQGQFIINSQAHPYNLKIDAYFKRHGRLPKLSTTLINKSLLLDIGLFDERISGRQDFDLFLRIVERCPFYNVNECLVVSDKSHKNRISNDTEALMQASLLIHEKYKSIVNGRSKIEYEYHRETLLSIINNNNFILAKNFYIQNISNKNKFTNFLIFYWYTKILMRKLVKKFIPLIHKFYVYFK